MVRDLLRRARRGAGGVVLVEGDPGTGRSGLLRDATDDAAELGFSLAAGAADPLGQAIPFFALRAALREPFAGLTADDPGRDLPDAAAWWITQIRAHLEQRAAAAPVLVCLDDLHWASPATLAALRALPRDLKRHPVAWLLARSSTSQRATDYLFGQLEQDGAARVTLAPLDQDAVAAMLTDAFGAPPDQALADLARGAAGQPLARGRADRRPARRSRRAGHRRTRRAGLGPAAAADSPPRAAAARWPQPAGPAAAGDGGGAGPGVPAGRRGRDARPDPGHAAARGRGGDGRRDHDRRRTRVHIPPPAAAPRGRRDDPAAGA